MTQLIRSTEAHGRDVRALAKALQVQSSSVASPPAPSAEVLEAQAALAEAQVQAQILRDAVDAAQTRLADAQGEIAKAYERGLAEGREAGLQAADTARHEAIAVLIQGVADGLAGQARQLGEFEALAVAIAEQALARILGDQSRFAEAVVEIVRGQAAVLASEAILKVEVSATDFPEGGDEVVRALGRAGVEVVAVSGLEPGSCRFRMRLGELDASLPEQWRRMSAVLAAAGEVR